MSSIDVICRCNARPGHSDGDDLYGRVSLLEHFYEIGYARKGKVHDRQTDLDAQLFDDLLCLLATRRRYGEIAVACKRLAEPYDKAKIIIDKKNGRR